MWSRVVHGLPIDFGKRCPLAEWDDRIKSPRLNADEQLGSDNKAGAGRDMEDYRPGESV
jgi:hypothetical protein